MVAILDSTPSLLLGPWPCTIEHCGPQTQRTESDRVGWVGQMIEYV